MSNVAILCVDDEIVVLQSLEIELRNAFGKAYRYEFAESADEALELIDELAEEQVRIILIVSDWLMPGTKGDDFLIQVHQKYPRVVTMMLTGHANEAAVERAKQFANLFACLYKPWDPEDLITTIKSALNIL